MQRVWVLRLIEVVAVAALLAEIWRFLTSKNTTRDVVADAIELVGLIIVGLVCLYVERRLRQTRQRPE